MPTTETIEAPAEASTEAPLPPHEAAVAFLRDRMQAGDTDTPPQPAEATETAPEAVEGEPAPEGQEAAESEPQEPAESEGEGEGEESKPEPAEEDPKKDKFATRFAALAREEKRITKMRDALKAEQAQLATFKAAVEKIKTDPLAALKELGVDYDELTRRVLSGGKPDAPDEVLELRERLDRLEKERQAEAEKEQQAQIQAAFAAAKRELADLSRDATKYPLASKWEPAEVAEQAFAIIERHFYETGKPLTYDEALGQIEARLVEHRRRLVGDEPQQPKPPAAPPKAITNGVVTSQGTALADLPFEDRMKSAEAYLKSRRR